MDTDEVTGKLKDIAGRAQRQESARSGDKALGGRCEKTSGRQGLEHLWKALKAQLNSPRHKGFRGKRVRKLTTNWIAPFTGEVLNALAGGHLLHDQNRT